MKANLLRSHSALLLSDHQKPKILSDIPIQIFHQKIKNNSTLPVVMKSKIIKTQYRLAPKRKKIDTQL